VSNYYRISIRYQDGQEERVFATVDNLDDALDYVERIQATSVEVVVMTRIPKEDIN